MTDTETACDPFAAILKKAATSTPFVQVREALKQPFKRPPLPDEATHEEAVNYYAARKRELDNATARNDRDLEAATQALDKLRAGRATDKTLTADELRTSLAQFKALLSAAFSVLVIRDPLNGWGITHTLYATYPAEHKRFLLGPYFLEVKDGKPFSMVNLRRKGPSDIVDAYHHPNFSSFYRGHGEPCYYHREANRASYNRFRDDLRAGRIVQGMLWLHEYLQSPPLGYVEKHNSQTRVKWWPPVPDRAELERQARRTAMLAKLKTIRATIAAETGKPELAQPQGFKPGDRVRMRASVEECVYGGDPNIRREAGRGIVAGVRAGHEYHGGVYTRVTVDFDDYSGFHCADFELEHAT